MQARKPIPQSHVDRGERDSDQTLGPEQTEPRGQLLLDVGRRKRLPGH